jgi:hypothetical protein
MSKPNWTYMLRILQRNPERIPMDRLGEYIRQFAELLGTENQPIFKGIKRASTGLKAAIPQGRVQYAHVRLVQAKTQPDSKPAKYLANIEEMLGADSIKEAQLLDASENVVYLFHGIADEKESTSRLTQVGSVDGVVTGLVGADDTMHLHLRDYMEHDLRLVIRDEEMARALLLQFRTGVVRVHVHGTWIRTDSGWLPEASKCSVDRFEVLEETPIGEVFAQLASIENNGWKDLPDPMAQWEALRGIH